ncbi:MAG: hypothetical protein GY694_18925, partial [Gammaproteobacteria bacterium]|nr:hypothetical protein [Gammaproteobacteria bacterium]
MTTPIEGQVQKKATGAPRQNLFKIDKNVTKDMPDNDDNDEKTWTTQQKKKNTKKFRMGFRNGLPKSKESETKLIKIKAAPGSTIFPHKVGRAGLINILHNNKIVHQSDILEIRLNNQDKWATLKITQKSPMTLSTNLPTTFSTPQLSWQLEEMSNSRLGVIRAMLDVDDPQLAFKNETENFLKAHNEAVVAAHPIQRGFLWVVQCKGNKLPASLITPFGERDVMRYVTGTTVCRNCLEIGHRAAVCKNQ